ncbi:YkyB family protein [Paenibacillus tianjinensis]|uniref:Uncharacterized protein n=1 Tax=Paenibacillus tianjinensis TaxID=2810347 RepID=A0ABX7LBA2_9BACL|nr:YkyB family protein [Paenibacillus tianjinensis]QSF43262.1 hypothetical protein JRJ22_18520 [Paenibacillus tianjinensis]
MKNIRHKTRYTKSKCSIDKLYKKQESLYDLKKQIIDQALLNGIAKREGIHKVKKSNGEEMSFVYVRFTNRSFHIPVDSNDCFEMDYLGDLSCRSYSPDYINNISTKKAKSFLNKYQFQK